MNLTYGPYDLMAMYGFRSLHELGSQTECYKVPDANYVLMTLNISYVPFHIYFGACIT